MNLTDVCTLMRCSITVAPLIPGGNQFHFLRTVSSRIAAAGLNHLAKMPSEEYCQFAGVEAVVSQAGG